MSLEMMMMFCSKYKSKLRKMTVFRGAWRRKLLSDFEKLRATRASIGGMVGCLRGWRTCVGGLLM